MSFIKSTKLMKLVNNLFEYKHVINYLLKWSGGQIVQVSSLSRVNMSIEERISNFCR